MQQKLNLKIKYREGFRPFAPSVLIEDVSTYFELHTESPYMLLVADVQQSIRKEVPADYHTKPMMDRLYIERSSLPSITHVDFSARVQTVSRETNPLYHRLLSAFKNKTGCGVLVNTSFNVRGEPPVLTPDDAFLCFMNTEMDVLVMGQYVLLKTEQPEWKKKVRKKEFNLD
jgi:carbamoyltransferase